MEREEIPSGVTYCTLSHCWGQVPNKIVLTTQNIHAWKLIIPDLSRLKTFTDAIHIARRLGFHYIWIDSLCIIQNSRQDWLDESARMSDVYKYSSCNISADSAVDDTIGCLFDRDLNIAFPLRLYFGARGADLHPTSDGRIVEIIEPSKLNGYYKLEVADLANWTRGVTTSAINKRAWVLQEVSKKNLTCITFDFIYLSRFSESLLQESYIIPTLSFSGSAVSSKCRKVILRGYLMP